MTALGAAYKKSHLAKLFAEPALAATLTKLTANGLDFGLQWTDIEVIAGGEVGWAVIPRDAKRTARVFYVDTTGKTAEAKKLIASLPEQLKKMGFILKKPTSGKPSDANVSVFYTKDGKKERAFAFKDGMLLCSDDETALERLLAHWPGHKASLAQLTAYKEVRRRAIAATKCPLHLFTYSTPEGLASLRREPSGQNKKTIDLMAKYEQQGLSAIKAIGAGVCLATEQFDLTYHVAIYAPGPHKNSMAMVKFCPGKDFTPPAWVPCNLSACGTAYFDVCNAFEHVGPLFDEVYGDGEKGTFKAVIKDLKADPNGPQVDIQHDLIDNLGKRLTVVTDSDLKLGSNAVRSLVAIETSKPKVIQKALGRLMDNDDAVIRGEFKHQVVWEIPAKKKKGVKGLLSTRPPSSAVCVAFGHLLLSNNIRLLERILNARRDGFDLR